MGTLVRAAALRRGGINKVAVALVNPKREKNEKFLSIFDAKNGNKSMHSTVCLKDERNLKF